MRFSIIVPVYNVEEYIERCMDSLVHQSFRDYEIIVVDDESPDNSMNIVETYRKKDPDRIRVVHQKNTRQGGARNHGVHLALGEYLIFVDSDDYVSLDMLEVADRRLREASCDILAFDCVHVDNQGKPVDREICDHLAPGYYIPKKNPEVVHLRVAPWGKVFRREFYIGTGFQFPEKLLYEDGVTRILYAKASGLVICEDPLYYYVHRENSVMTQKISEKMLDILTMTDLTRKEFEKAGLYDIFKAPLEVSLIYSLLCILEIINDQDPQNPMQKKITAYIRENFADYRKIPGIDPMLVKILDCLTADKFLIYHYRYLLINRMKEKLLQDPVISRINELRKRH